MNIAKIKQRLPRPMAGNPHRSRRIPAEVLDGKHHPCFRCGGKDRFRMIDAEAGDLYCNACFSTDNGDGISALRWASGKPFKEVVAMLADYLHLNGNGHVKTSDGKAKLAESDKAIKSIDSPSGDVLLHVYCKAKPPITPDGIKRCGGNLVTGAGFDVHPFRRPRTDQHREPTAIILCRNDGKPFPARRPSASANAYQRGSINSWMVCGDVNTAETIIDLEGITDWLAVASLGLPPGWAAVTNTAGAKARGKLPRPWAKGKRIIVAGDADEPGQEGQKRAAAAYLQSGAECCWRNPISN